VPRKVEKTMGFSSREKNQLGEASYKKLPLGAIKAKGWLKNQLIAQKEGLTGNLDEYWLYNSWWKGENGNNKCMVTGKSFIGPDFLNGLACLAYTLDDESLKEKLKSYVEYILSSMREDGNFGPEKINEGRYLQGAHLGRSKALRMLISYYEASGDERIVDFIENYYKKFLKNYHDKDNIRMGWFNNSLDQEDILAGVWLYNITNDPSILEITEKIYNQIEKEGQWLKAFKEGEVANRHGYNISHALKYPAYIYMLTESPECKAAVDKVLEMLHSKYGQIGGRFAAHEHLPGRDGKNPTHGSELCHIVEMMYSLEKLLEIFGDPKYVDNLESLAFNAFPGMCTGDFWAHQYDQQTNQVLVNVGQRRFDNSDYANIFGLEPHYPCCLGNMHHAWPRFVEHMWMGTNDGGLIAMSYCPCVVEGKVDENVEVKLHVKSEYPFNGKIRIEVNLPEKSEFPLYFRIPSMKVHIARKAWISVGGKKYKGEPGTIVCVERQWDDGDIIEIELPFCVYTERITENSVAVKYGLLYFALRIEEEYKQLKYNFLGSADWEIKPLSPWNVALVSNIDHMGDSVKLTKNEISKYPFSHKGEMIWNKEKDCFKKWGEEEPVVLKLNARIIPEWKMHPVWAMADNIPENITEWGDAVKIELIPYGCSNLRIAEFPFVK